MRAAVRMGRRVTRRRFWRAAARRLPWERARRARVLPQPGQWRPVAAWMGQGGSAGRRAAAATVAERMAVVMRRRGMERRGEGEFTRGGRWKL